jgi:pyridinium-3,5-biscarboxylic acid mononucleotide sulfurtransferase
MTLEQKTKKIKSLIKEMNSVLVAFSGGVDSTLVLALAHEVLGKNSLGVTAQSASVPDREMKASSQLAEEIGAKHLVIKTEEMSNPNYRANPANRCYHCKSELYSSLKKVADQKNISHILNGTNTDDLGDYRPGLESAREQGVRSPLVEAEFNKQDIRELSKIMGLSIWNKPAMACLSSRIPYGQEVTPEKLSMVERAEDLLLSLGFEQLRVRHHGDLARIELGQSEMPRYLRNQDTQNIVQEKFKALGFSTVVLDPEGYRMGSLNAALENKTAQK